jgi:predicted amidohydrolase YtcJ
MIRIMPAMAAAAMFLATQIAAAEPSKKAELILRNGVIYTLDPANRIVQSVAVSGGRIAYLGGNQGSEPLRGRHTQVIDLQGGVVLPGLSDAHVHPALGEFLHQRLCDVRGFTVDEGFAKLRRCATAAPPGDWVVGFGWYDVDNPAFDRLKLAQLDALVPDRKLAVISWDLHTLWANSKTLAEFGIGPTTASPPGGEIARDSATGAATGMLIDAANAAITERIRHHSPYAVPEAELLQLAMSHLNSLGITSILDAYVDDDTAAAYHDLDRAGKLSMRVSLAVPVLPSNYRTEIPRIEGNRDKWQSPRVRFDFVKVFADGNPEVGLSSLLNHDGPPETSTPGYYTAPQMRELVALAEQKSLSIFVHAIGDGAAREVLDAVAAARQSAPATERRHTLTHLCWVDDADLPRFQQLHVIANIQEGWLAPSAFGGPPGYDYARTTAAGPIGPWLGGRLMPYRPLRDAGAFLAGGSDWFYTEENPWFTMEAGITSKDPGSSNTQAMIPNHAMDLMTVMRARTTGAAYQMYRENETGSLEVGKRGDLIVVDQDPFRVQPQELHKTSVIMTFLDGTLIYRRPGSPAVGTP